METQLLDFVRQVTTMADIRNMDPRNPIALDFDFPGMSQRYRIVGSITEPTANAYPINLLWVVLDAESPFYQTVLQLKSATPDDTSIADRVQDSRGPMLGTWVDVPTYDQLYAFPQYYLANSGGGQPGPAGKDGYIVRGNWSAETTYNKDHTVYHQGSSYASTIDNNQGKEPGIVVTPPGQPEEYDGWIMVAREGAEAYVDYERIINDAVARYNPLPRSLEIRELPAIMYSNDTARFEVWAIYPTGASSRLEVGKYNMEYDRSLGLVDMANENVTVVANDLNGYMYLTAVLVDNEDVRGDATINTKRLVPVSLTVNGPATIRETEAGQYSATATFNNGTTEVVGAGPARVWSVTPAAAGSIDQAGLFRTNDVAATTAAVVKCTYTYGPVTVEGTRNVSVTNVVAQKFARFGAAAAVTNTAEFTSEFVNNVCASQVAQSGLTNGFNLSLAAGMYGYYAHPKAWGVARFEDLDAPGFYGAWDGARNNILDPSMWGPFEVNATVNGVTEPWLVYRTDHNGLGATRWSITPMP